MGKLNTLSEPTTAPGDAALIVDQELLSPPSWLAPEAREFWNRVVPHLDAKAIDWSSIVALCTFYADWIDCVKAMKGQPLFITGSRGKLSLNPMRVAMDKAATGYLKARARFGLMPTAIGRPSHATPQASMGDADEMDC